jgi:DNA-binding NarL/FixJ family response regulator
MDILRYLTNYFPDIPVIIYSLHNHPKSIHEARELGAIGFISKLTELSKIIDVLRNLNVNSNFFTLDERTMSTETA